MKWKIFAGVISFLFVCIFLILAIPFFAEYKFKNLLKKIETRFQNVISYTDFSLKSHSEFNVKGIRIADVCGFNFFIKEAKVKLNPYSFIEAKTEIESIHIFEPDFYIIKTSLCLKKYNNLFYRNSGKSAPGPSFSSSLIPQKIFIQDASLKLEEKTPFFDKFTNGSFIVENKSLFRDTAIYELKGKFNINSENNTEIMAEIDPNRRSFFLSLNFSQKIERKWENKRLLLGGFSIQSDRILSLKDIYFFKGKNENFSAKEIKMKLNQSSEKENIKTSGISKIFSDMLPSFFKEFEIVEFEGNNVQIAVNLQSIEKNKEKNVETENIGEKEKSEFSKRIQVFFNNFEGKIKSFRDYINKITKELPFNKFKINKGDIKYLSAVDKEKKLLNEWTKLYLNAKKTKENKVKYKLEFELPQVEGKRNTISGNVDFLSGNQFAKMQFEEIPVYEFRNFFPSFVELKEDSTIHHTELNFVYNNTDQIVEIKGEFYINNINLFIPQIALDTMRNLNLGLSLNIQIDLEKEAIKIKKSKFYLNKIQFNIESLIKNFKKSPEINVSINFPRTRCVDIVQSLPVEIIPVLEGVKIEGSFSFSLDGSLNTSDINSLKYEFKPDLSDVIVFDMGKHINFELLTQSFIHRIQESGGNVIERKIGSSSPEWTPLEEISKYLILAITTTEDAGFFQHHGFSPYAIRQSLIRNLEKGEFLRGASTISQQLVKNLFLSTEKTISRKLQEAFITWQMEKFLAKEKILELYFNVIEFGPDIYGIRQASHHYFSKEPIDLNLIESVFLVTIIPNPKKFYKEFERERISEKFRLKLQRILKVMLKRGKITLDEYLSSSSFIPQFVKAKGEE